MRPSERSAGPARMRPPSLRLPFRLLRGHIGRLALTLIALAWGVALVCAIDVVNRAVLSAFVEVIDTMAGRAALEIAAGEGALFPEDVATRAAAVPGVELAVPVVTAAAFATDGSGELMSVHGVDVTNDAAIRVYHVRDEGGLPIDDPLVFLSQADSILLARSFAGPRGLEVGTKLELETPTGRRRFTVRGLIEPEGIGRVHGGNLVVMDLFAAERAFTRPGLINRVDVVVARDSEVTVVRNALASVLPEGLQVTAPAQRKVDLHRVMRSVQVMLQGVSLLVLLAAFLIVFNRLSAVFEARIWQVGVMRAMGLRPTDVWLELLAESLLIGAAGVAAGLASGVGLARLMLPVIATTTALASKLTVPSARFVVGWSSLDAGRFVGPRSDLPPGHRRGLRCPPARRGPAQRVATPADRLCGADAPAGGRRSRPESAADRADGGDAGRRVRRRHLAVGGRQQRRAVRDPCHARHLPG